jgi:predicted CoA-binding protein
MASKTKPAKNKTGRGTRPAPVPDAAASVRPEHGRALHAIFAPTRVAVVGASEKEGSVGRAVFWNLITNPFGGTVFPVNPKRTSVLGVKAYPSLSSLPEPVDLVVVVTPAAAVPAVIAESVRTGVTAILPRGAASIQRFSFAGWFAGWFAGQRLPFGRRYIR